ncbi:serine hydrolase domain-containing protein [Arthrobacter sp. NPDC090010]|uniref:serine hydrolase domain-containing protein n=1 Tax=Arthrobacter sp. NPDC090010 TaxID=3363942 RepID=UPI0038283110
MTQRPPGPETLRVLLEQALHPDDGGDPLFSGAVAAVRVNGQTVAEASAGLTFRYRDGEGLERRGDPVSRDALFDLASITKIFVTATALAAFEERHMLGNGLSSLRRPVSEWLPEFRPEPFGDVTVLDLLTHRSGLPSEWDANSPGPDAWHRFRTTMPEHPAGTVHAYSCVGFIWLGLLLEELSGSSLDDLMTRLILDPLDLSRTGYRPTETRDRIVATEIQTGRGLVHGEVHDETAWALGGVSGNAGLFSTAPELLRFAEMLRNGGTSAGRRILSREAVELMTKPVPGPLSGEFRQGLGLRLGEPAARLFARDAERLPAGHGGFTGTAFAFVPGGERSVVLLSNRVHPRRGNDERFASFRQDVLEWAAGRI